MSGYIGVNLQEQHKATFGYFQLLFVTICLEMIDTKK